MVSLTLAAIGWPDSLGGLRSLKEHAIIGTLSNGSVRLLIDMVCLSSSLRIGCEWNPVSPLVRSIRLRMPTFRGTSFSAVRFSALTNRKHLALLARSNY